MSVRKTAKEVGISVPTAFFWRHKALAALRTLDRPILAGVIESDETYFRHSLKGMKRLHDLVGREPKKRGEAATKRGLSREQVCVIVARDRHALTVAEVGGRGVPKVQAVKRVLEPDLDRESVLCTDGASSYKRFCTDIGVAHYVDNGKRATGSIYHINNVNNWHGRLKGWMIRFKGVATKYLNNYLMWTCFVCHHGRRGSMKRLLVIVAVLLLGYMGYKGFVGGDLSAEEAKQVVLGDIRANSAFRQNKAFDPATLEVGQMKALEASHNERGPIPPRWRVEVLLPEGKLFATYWVDRTTGKVYALDIDWLGDEILDPKMPALVREEPGTPEGNARHLEEMLQDETAQIHEWLRIALGDEVPCESPCVRDTDFSRVVKLVLYHCVKVNPTSLRNHPGFAPDKHERMISAFEQSCSSLMGAQSSLGVPKATSEWKQRVKEATDLLARR